MDQFSNLIRFPELSDSVGQTSIWAVTAVLLALIFRAPLSAAIASSDGLEAELGPVKVRLTKSLAAVRRAAEVRTTQGVSRKLSEQELRKAATEARSRGFDRLAHKVVLWVDDYPANNDLERHAFEALGVRFVNVLSTDDAVRLLKTTTFDLVISDMGRDSEGPNAGLDFIAAHSTITALPASRVLHQSRRCGASSRC